MNILAGGAGAGAMTSDAGQAVFETDISIFDQFKQGLAAQDPVFGRIRKDGVTFDLDQGQQWVHLVDQKFQQIPDNFLSMIELGPGYIGVVTGNICQYKVPVFSVDAHVPGMIYAAA